MPNPIIGYTGKYISIYFWRGASIVLNLLSMVVVIPRITMYPSIYGIYAICMATTVFLSYADLGFMSAATKYAGEYFARGEKVKEKEVLGFSIFILVIFVGIIALLYFMVSIKPTLLITDVTSEYEITIASQILFLQGFFSINLILRRFVNSVFGIRIEEYILQRFFSVSNLIKISSVFYFFSDTNYDIVGYFFFIKFVELIAIIIGIIVAEKKYDYDIMGFLKYINFSKKVFFQIKDLALTSFYVTIAYVLYFELDQIVIGKWIGIDAVAIYAIGFTLLTYFRTLSGVLFAPFQHRYNHFIGLKNMTGLRTFLKKVLDMSFPIIVLPTLTLIILMDQFIFAWVGHEYAESIGLSRVLIATGFYIFLIVPGSNILVSLNQIKPLYILNTIMMIVFWVGVGISGNYLGVMAFAIFKFAAFSISFIYYFFFMTKFLKINVFKNIYFYSKKIFLPILFVVITSLWVRNRITLEKTIGDLLIIILVIGLISMIGLGIYLLSHSRLRLKVINIYRQI